MRLKQRQTDCIVVSAFLLLCWAYFNFAVPYQIGFKEQTAAFIMEPGLIASYFAKPAALARLAGDFLTQFFYIKALGPVISVLSLLLLWFSLRVAMNLCRPGRDNAFAALMPVALELGFLVKLNYPLSATIGMALAAFAFAAVASVSCKKLRTVLFFAVSPVVFALAGGHVITYSILCVWYMVREKQLLPAVALFAFAMTAMLLMGRWYNLSVQDTFIYPSVSGYVTPDKHALLLSPILLILGLASERRGQLIFALVTLIPSAFFSYDRNMEFNTELVTRAYKEEWNEIKQRTVELDGVNAMSIFYRNLCSAREGRLAEDLLLHAQMPQGGLAFNVMPGVSYLSVFADIDMFIEVGDISQATDCALLCQTIMPSNNSARTLRSLSEISMITGDYAVAVKYLDMLSSTLMHRDWANDMKECIRTDSMPENILIYRARTALLDAFYAQNDNEGSLESLLRGNPLNKNASDYLLCSYLLAKKVGSFEGAYRELWLGSLDHIYEVPELYQEALLVNVESQQDYIDAVAEYGISEKVQQRYFDFMSLTNNTDSKQYVPKTPIEELKKTYWSYIMNTSISHPNEN